MRFFFNLSSLILFIDVNYVIFYSIHETQLFSLV